MSADNRQDVDNQKYKQFRNFMVNELGITRQDIEAWTKQAVANEVNKIIGQINVSEERLIELANSQIKKTVNEALGMNSRYGNDSRLLDKVVSELTKQLQISIK